MRLNNFSIGRRLTVALASLLALCLFSSLLGITQLARLGDVVDAMLHESVETEHAASDMYSLLTVAVMRTTAIAKSSDATLGDFFAPSTAEAIQRGGVLFNRLEARMKSPQQQALFAKVLAGRTAYNAARDEAMRLKKVGPNEAAQQALDSGFVPCAKAYEAVLAETVEFERAEVRTAGERIGTIRRQSTALLAIACVASLALGTLLAWKLTTSITRPLKRAQVMARRISEMDLSDLGRDGAAFAARDETGELLRSLESMRAMLASTVAQVRASTETIRIASSEVATGTLDLSQRTEQTAANLQQAAASMDTLSGTVAQSTSSARQANALASSAAETAARGSTVVSQVVATMVDINASSKRIADITGVIDGIAFQTNILALNAAVEAARAGEHGRGFAVVASEVRALAGRSATAAREIKTLIADSVERIDAGSRCVTDAGTTMKDIEGSIQRVSTIIGEVTAASSEQSGGIGQIHAAVLQLDQMTQQNATLVEESSAASESLRNQATTLAELVAKFRLDPVP